jgi:ATP-dependent Clp protease adaptor protein ClpS
LADIAEKTLAQLQKANIIGQRLASSPRADMSENGKRGEEGPGTGVVVKAKPKTKKPSMYKVLMLNDDYTPMEFVVHILERFFNKNRSEATRIMLHVHRRGVGVCGVYTYEVAETISKSPFIGLSHAPTSAGTNMPRSSICCSR